MNRFLINHTKSRSVILLLTVFSLFVTSFQLSAREANPKAEIISGSKRPFPSKAALDPTVDYIAHSRGNMQLVVANNGQFGTFGGNIIDPITGQQIQSCIYPKNSNVVFLWVGALWIGGIVGRDTLVSCATEDFYNVREFWPDAKLREDDLGFTVESNDGASSYYSENARSEEDYYCEYTDTVTNSGLTGNDTDPQSRPHRPLNIKVFQRTMAWSYDYADDFILFDYQIENIGNKELREVYMGIFVDGDTWHKAYEGPQGWNDDIVGFKPTYPAPEGHGFIDTVNIAYSADNDGDPVNGAWNDSSATSVVGVKIVRTPSDSLKYSYNWWRIDYTNPALDFGPRKRETADDPFRDFGDRLGTPVGDKNKYYVLRHNEFDYDLLYTAVDHTDEGYLPPPNNAVEYAMGYDTRYLLSFGPFNISPGEKLPITFAWVGGENFHVDPTAFESHDPYKPDIFYNKLNFSDFAGNTRWASWVYDNPGVDTDGDGYFGKYRLIPLDSIAVDSTTDSTKAINDTVWTFIYDTSWYEGDGVPDFKGASPPPAPKFWVYPQKESIRVRINGINSELAKDQFSNIQDFEGYRIYVGRDNLKTGYSLVASYDKKNYNKYVYNDLKNPPTYELRDIPFTLEELRCLYATDSCGDTTFIPEEFTRANPFTHPDYPDSIFYFIPNDYNAGDFGVSTPITKRFPDAPYPQSLDPDSASADDLTDDGYLKYFEYEFTVPNLLPTVPWYVNVTAFDFGSPQTGLGPLESSVVNNAQMVYPLYSYEEQEAEDLPIYVYPNPYRIDADYRSQGFEGRNSSFQSDDRIRVLNFANLPPKCTIQIFSIDGDLIIEWEHDKDSSDPNASHDEWNLITRNTQLIVSGLYYYVVEWDGGSHIGKFAIIM